jgi:probable HAF family extracellular repeat protein
MRVSVSRWVLAVQAGLSLALIAAASCRGDRPAGPELATLPSFAKGGGSPPKGDVTVGSTSPDSAPRNTTLTVTISGSGFEQGSRAIWALNGDTAFATTKIKTNSTTFVSSSQVRASITIGGDAPVDQYDVQVVTLSGRKGIGIELFTVTYEVIDLGAGDGSASVAINARGQIVGVTPAGSFIWENGVIRQLAAPVGFSSWRAEDINSNGVVVGYGQNSSGASQAIIWTAAGGARVLAGSLGGSFTLARRINDQGLIVGEAGVPGGGAAHAVVWENEIIRDVQAFATGSTYPWGLSNSGIVVGQWNPTEAGFSWTASGGMALMAGLDGPADIPLAVNDYGQIVGWYRRTSTDPTAFLWVNGVITDLGTLGGSQSVALGINNVGQVVGRSQIGAPRRVNAPFHAFLWTAGGGMRDLGTLPGRDYAAATDINDGGMVVGQTWPGSGLSRATLWKVK